MNRSPDLRIEARRSAFPGSVSVDTGSSGWCVSHRETVPLPAYSGGTVWDLRPLPMFTWKHRTIRQIIPNLDTRRPAPGVSLFRLMNLVWME